MAYTKKDTGAKPERPIDPNDPAVIEEQRMARDNTQAQARSEEEQAKITRIAEEDRQKIATAAQAREAEETAIRERENAATRARLNQPISEEEQTELDGLEIEARSGRQVDRPQMLRLGELRTRAENVKKPKK